MLSSEFYMLFTWTFTARMVLLFFILAYFSLENGLTWFVFMQSLLVAIVLVARHNVPGIAESASNVPLFRYIKPVVSGTEILHVWALGAVWTKLHDDRADYAPIYLVLLAIKIAEAVALAFVNGKSSFLEHERAAPMTGKADTM